VSIKDTVLFHLGQVELHDPLEGVRDSLDPRFGGTATPETVKSIGEIGASVLFLDHEGQEGMHHLGMHIDTLHANTGRYFEMHPDFMPIHAISPTRLEAMEARLAKLPLVHRTNADPLRPGPKESGGQYIRPQYHIRL
jgi:hypothetical protein